MDFLEIFWGPTSACTNSHQRLAFGLSFVGRNLTLVCWIPKWGRKNAGIELEFFFNYACHRIALFGHFGSRHKLKGSLTSPFLCNSRVSVVDKNQKVINRSHSAILGIHNWTSSSQLSSLFSTANSWFYFEGRAWGHGVSTNSPLIGVYHLSYFWFFFLIILKITLDNWELVVLVWF